MKITRQNYPEYFLDHHEGRLSEAARAELMDFLALHPDLKDEFEAFAAVSLEPDPAVEFPLKGSLKRGEVTPENYDWYLAAYISGDLSPSEMREVKHFAETRPKYARDFALMKHTLLEPDTSVVFESKAALKRHVIVLGEARTDGVVAGAGHEGAAVGPAASGTKTRRLIPQKVWYYASAAAVVMIMAGLFFMRGPESSMTGPGATDPTLVYETPAAGTVDQPEAVAEVPPSQQVTAIEADPAATGTPATGEAASRTPSAVAPGEAGTAAPAIGTTAAGTGREPVAPQPAAPLSVPSQVSAGPTLASMAPVIGSQGFTRSRPDVGLQQRNDFEYWDARMVSADALLAGGYELAGAKPSLSQMARARLQESLPLDAGQAETLLAEGGNTLRNIARTGVGTIERLASSVLNPEPLPEEEGRKVEFALGSVLRVSRTASPE